MYAWIQWLRFPQLSKALSDRQREREILARWQETANIAAHLLVASIEERQDGVSDEVSIHGKLYQPLSSYSLARKVGLALRKRPIKQFYLEYKVEKDRVYDVLVLRLSVIIPPSSTREDWKELHGIY